MDQQGGSSFANTVTITNNSEENVNLTQAKYQQLLSLLNFQAHFGT